MGTVEKMPQAQETEKSRLRKLIVDLTDEMRNAIGTEEFADKKGALDTVLSVYRTLNNTGDLDEDQGSAITAYGKEIANGRRGPGRR